MFISFGSSLYWCLGWDGLQSSHYRWVWRDLNGLLAWLAWNDSDLSRRGQWLTALNLITPTISSSHWQVGSRFGLAYMDVSTGEFFATELDDFSSVCSEIQNLKAREVVVGYDYLKLMGKFWWNNSACFSQGNRGLRWCPLDWLAWQIWKAV